MLSPEEVEATKRRNYHSIRELIRVAYTLGMNLMRPNRCGYALNIITVVMVVSSTLSLYAHWSLIERYMHEIPLIVETICTTFQALMSVVKLTYYLFKQRRFYQMLKMARTHALLQQCEIFQHGFPIHNQLKDEVDNIMLSYWRSTRRQLLFYLFCCIAIVSNYYINSYLVNLYNYFRQTPDYKPVLPFPSVYPEWEDKGMTFPYYAMEMFPGTCAVWIAGMGAVSFDCLFIVLCLHSVALMKALMAMVRSSTSELVPKSRRVEYLRYCIYQYQRTSAYALTLHDIYQHAMLPQFLMSLLVWGLVIFQLAFSIDTSKTLLLRMVMYIMAAGYQIVIYCYNGQLFTSASEEIPNAFYNCDWYMECREFRQLIQMMIMRTNSCQFLDISWFTTMSLPTLMAMVRSSGSYFLLLRNITEK